MAEALDRDPWLLFDLRGKTRDEVLAALQAHLGEEAPTPAPKKRGRPKKVATLADLLVRRVAEAEPWHALDGEAYDALRAPLPAFAIPRAIPSDPSVFTQLGPLPHARIETSLCLAALLHRCAQWTIAQIEEGGSLEDQQAQAGEGAPEAVASPFDSPLPPMPAKPPKAWRNKKRRWK
jgi:hypothetical protein